MKKDRAYAFSTNINSKPIHTRETDETYNDGERPSISKNVEGPIQSRRFLIETKFQIPQVSHGLIVRERLNQRLRRVLECKLTLISAPAGFGKTTLIGSWATDPENESLTAWVSLDRNDNDSIRFWQYASSSLARLVSLPEWNPYNSGADFQIETLAAWLSEFDNQSAKEYCLIFDDFHWIDSQDILTNMAFLIEHLPPCFHVILSSRTTPSFPVARLRANGQLLELGPDDLRFNDEEAIAFLREIMGLDLPHHSLSTLSKRTEGWVAGLQLTALSLIGREDAKEVIQAFSGADRYILDYLLEEVLLRQSDATREFLLKTSILPRMNASLCDALLNPCDSLAILEELDRSNLFLVALDRERGWYRYHHLFAEALRERLSRDEAEEIAVLHLRASQWFEENEWIPEAIDHALAAEDYSRTAFLLEKITVSILQKGEVLRLNAWMEALPKELLSSHPRLSLAYAWILVLFKKISDAERFLRCAEDALGVPGHEPSINKFHGELNGEIAAIRVMIFSIQDDLKETLNNYHIARDLLPLDDYWSRWSVEFSLGFLHFNHRQYTDAYPFFLRALEISRSPLQIYPAALTLEYLNKIHGLKGELSAVAENAECLLRLGREKGAYLNPRLDCIARLLLGSVHYERNRLKEAEENFNKAVSTASALVNDKLLPVTLYELARLRRSLCDGDGVGEIYSRFCGLLPGDYPPEYQEFFTLYKVRVGIWLDDRDVVADWWEKHKNNRALTYEFPYDLEPLTHCRVLIYLNRPEEAQAILEELSAFAVDAGLSAVVIRTKILHAMVHRSLGDFAEAKRLLIEALKLAAPSEYVRSFLDEGDCIAELLHDIAASSSNETEDELDAITRRYINQLLSAFGELPLSKPTEAFRSEDKTPSLLSERELEILRHIADGLSNREIALGLFIADSTVKKHLSNIFDKLQVHNRTRAVAAARELGLL